jgi:hypothetical protein
MLGLLRREILTVFAPGGRDCGALRGSRNDPWNDRSDLAGSRRQRGRALHNCSRLGKNSIGASNGSSIRIRDQGRIPPCDSIEFDIVAIDPEMISDGSYYCCPVGFVGF